MLHVFSLVLLLQQQQLSLIPFEQYIFILASNIYIFSYHLHARFFRSSLLSFNLSYINNLHSSN